MSLSAQERIAVGRQIGELARLRYTHGRLVPHADNPVAATRVLIEGGASCLFEATVASEGRFARIDVLWRDGDGAWVIDEVKSSSAKDPSRLDREKRLDLAFQVLTAQRAGFEVSAARFVLIDGSNPWTPPLPPIPVNVKLGKGGQLSLFPPENEPSGAMYDPHRMLTTVDMTGVLGKLIPEVEILAREAISALESDVEPVVETNTHCKKCDFFDYCHAETSTHDVIFLPGIRPKEVRSLRLAGHHSIDQIPDEYGLTEQYLRVREAIRTGQPQISPRLRERLEAISFPAAFIDYETSSSAFPVLPGTRPYQSICFQWSAHVVDSPNSEPKHFEFLSTDGRDPRAEFCRTLLEVLSTCRSVLHYAPYERIQIRNMAADEVPLASAVNEILEERAIDLHEIIEECVYYPQFKGRTSIKVVLPTLVPSMSYADLLIADGQAAATGYREMTDPATSAQRRAELKEALLRYCEQDTLAMVEIWKALGGAWR